jgi:hypothetical protein
MKRLYQRWVQYNERMQAAKDLVCRLKRKCEYENKNAVYLLWKRHNELHREFSLGKV